MALDFLWDFVLQQTSRELLFAFPGALGHLATGAICTLIAITIGGIFILRRHGNSSHGRIHQGMLESADQLLRRAEEEAALLELLQPLQFDPLECLVHIQGKLKRKLNEEAKRRLLLLETGVAANRMSGEEASVERDQLDAIYRLIERCGTDFDSIDFEQQKKLYLE